MEVLKIIKRLELLKNLISLEEEEDMAYHISKLQPTEFQEEVNNIINLIKKKEFVHAIVAINKFINQQKQLEFYIDPEIEAIRFEAKKIEVKIQKLNDEKAELEKLIHEFSVRHNQELGELLLKILKYRKEKYKGTEQEEETIKDYADFHTLFESTKNEKINTLTLEEQKELKDNYRKASKLCHPDVVSEQQKEAANKLFMELNASYERNDLQKVSEILEDLQKGKAFTSITDIVNEKNSLFAELERLRRRLNELEMDVFGIKTSELFEKITIIKDWNEYFTQIKQMLQEQLSQLENGRI